MSISNVQATIDGAGVGPLRPDASATASKSGAQGNPPEAQQQRTGLQDPGERVLIADIWDATPLADRQLSGGPAVPELPGADLARSVEHAVDFVLNRIG